MKSQLKLRWLLTLAIVGTVVPGVVNAPTAQAVPAGFTEQTVFSGLNEPIDVEFSPDGRVFIAEKRGVVKVFDGLADTTATTVADLRTQVYNNGDRGLMSIELSPTFPTDPSLYVLYSRDAAVGGTAPRWGTPNSDADPCPSPPGDTVDGCVNSGRLSRLTVSATTTGPEQVLVDGWCAQYNSHSVADLAFGPDGFLYAGGGEGAAWNFADYGQAGNPKNPCGDPPSGVGGNQTVPSAEGGALRSQDIQTLGDPMGLNGTVIRIDPSTGAGAPGNPFAGSADANLRRVVAAGLRNPFRMAFRPESGELWLGDVGWSQTEEIDRLIAPIDGTVDNFGWPCKEGHGTNGYDIGLTLCENILNNLVPTAGPYYNYSHGSAVVSGDGCSNSDGSSLSGLAFYPGGSYPAQYDNAMFFADYSRSCIWVMLAGADGLPSPSTRTLFHPSGVYPVDLQIGPNNDLFYVDIGVGALRRIVYSVANQAPTAAITATPTQGPAPLSVSFSGTGSDDPDGDPLSYTWDFDGNGSADATGPTASFTYTTPGAYDASVRVTDPGGLSSTAVRRILVGTTPPVPTITSPAPALRYTAGQSINFAGSATDAEDGTLPPSSLSWAFVQHHCPSVDACHEHPITSMAGVASGTSGAPDHEYPSFLEIRLTAVDSSGVSATTSMRLDPAVVNLTIASSPPGLVATLSSRTATTPFTAQVIVNGQLSLSTPDPQALGGSTYAFSSWSDGGARAHNITGPSSDQTITATFTPVTTGNPGLMAAYSFDEGSGATVIDRSGRGHDGAVFQAVWSTAGRSGGALSFDGVNDWVTVADHADLDLSGGMTLEAWVRPATTTGWRTAMIKEGCGGLCYALYGGGNPQPSGWATMGTTERGVIGPSTLEANTWAHVAVTYDGTILRLYVNGAQVATQAQTGAITASTGALRLGGNAVWGEFFGGLIDDARIYNRALTPAEIVTDGAVPVAGDTTPPSRPTNLTATGSQGMVQLAWAQSTDNNGVSGYDVHRSTTAGFTAGPTTRIATAPANSYTDNGLAAGVYHYQVVARDAAGNVSAPSNEASATVTGDVTPPSVSITSPAGGAIVSGTVTVTATAADTGGVAGVQFRLDGNPLGLEDTTSPYSVAWNTTTATNGGHTLTAVARDASANTTTSSPVTVTVNNTIPPVPTGLMAAYNFNEGSGATVIDRSGRAHNGAVFQAVWSTAGHTAGALSFDGVNDWVTVADHADLDLTSAMTLEAWVRPTTTTGWRTAMIKEGCGGLCYALYGSGSPARPSGYATMGITERGVTGPSTLAANTWAHVAVTYDGTTMRLYVNGTQFATQAQTGNITTSTGALRLGGNAVWGEFFSGLIDDARIYNRALTAAQIVTDRDTPVG